MKQQITKTICIIVLCALSLGICGCNIKEAETVESDISSPEADCIINGKEFFFVEDEVKKEWKEPIAKLLSNVLVSYGEKGEIFGYKVTGDPKEPAIPECYSCGLLDVNEDGVPELLLHPFGYHGSSGTSTYFAYNIYSGQKLGEIDGGNAESWCFYYDTVNDNTKLVGQYWLRGGWPYRGRYITEVYYDEAIMECYELIYLHTSHEIEHEYTEYVDGEPNYDSEWFEIYPSTAYSVHNRDVDLDTYYAEYDSFVRTCVRIHETELVLFYWGDVSDDTDDYATRGEKMAEALVSSSQEFIIPD